jgi:hypothetical protein
MQQQQQQQQQEQHDAATNLNGRNLEIKRG